MATPIPWGKNSARAELFCIYEEADALAAGATCICTDAPDAASAHCCHFGLLGREPYVTEAELAEVRYAIATSGSLRGRRARTRTTSHARRLPLAPDPHTCPLLSSQGRCTIYASRPLGCRTFFCRGQEPPGTRRPLMELARRLAALSARSFPWGAGPRPLTSALAAQTPAAPKKHSIW